MERTTIKSLVAEYGIENLLFLVPRNSFGGEERIPVPCKIVERWNREVEKEYKLILKPIDTKAYPFNEDDIYVSDLQSLIREGIYQVFVKPKLGWPLSKLDETAQA